MTPGHCETHVVWGTGEVSTLENHEYYWAFDTQCQSSSPDIQSQCVSVAGLLECSLCLAFSSGLVWRSCPHRSMWDTVLQYSPPNSFTSHRSPYPIPDSGPEPGPASPQLSTSCGDLKTHLEDSHPRPHLFLCPHYSVEDSHAGHCCHGKSTAAGAYLYSLI